MTIIPQLEAKIYKALIDRLDLMPGGYAIVEPGENYPTQADTPFIVVQDVRFEPTSPFVGGSTQNENRGQFSLAVMVPLEWTHFNALTVAGLIRAQFPKSAKYVNDGVTVCILETPSYVGNAYRDGPFNRLPVSVRWRAAG